MAYFSELNTGIIEVERLLLANANLCKLLYHTDTTDPLSATPVADPKILRMESLFPLPKAPNLETDKKAIVNYYFWTAQPQRRNPRFNTVTLHFDIACELGVWPIVGGLRPYAIAQAIDSIFNDATNAKLTIGDIWLKDMMGQRYSDTYYGYHLVYQMGQDSNAGAC